MGLSTLIRDGLGRALDSSDGRFVAEISVKYLVGAITAYQFQHAIKKVDLTDTIYSGKTFRLALMDKAYFILQMKYAALNMALKPNNVALLQLIHEGFGLVRNDVVLLKTIFSRQAYRTEIRSSKRMKEVNPKEIGVADMNKVRRNFAAFQTPVMKHIKNKTYKKLRFVANAENSEFRDLHSEVMTKALKVYYFMVPTTKSEAHILNYIRQSCSHHVLNIINASTTEKRGRLKNAGKDGYGGSKFELTVVSENQAMVSPDQEYNYESVLGSANVSDNAKLESDVVVSRLLAKFKGRKKTALLILCGHYDSKFTKWLLDRNRIKEGEDHHDLQTRVAHTTFIGLLAEYLGVIRECFERFVAYVGRSLKAHLEYA